LLIGCVAEATPKFLDQALRLLRSVRWFGGMVREAEFALCVVGDSIEAAYREKFEALNARIRFVERFSDVHPQSNKLRFLELKETLSANRIVLLDCDTVVVRDPSPFLRASDFQAKIADVPTVRQETFERLFADFDLPMPACDQYTSVNRLPTIPYFNAGVLIFSKFATQRLIPTWIDLNRQLIARRDLLGDDENFCEQASLSLALVAENVNFAVLGNEMNFPVHFGLPVESAFGQTDPAIIHYHSLIADDGLLLPSRYPAVNRRIEQFNGRMRQLI
jgi:hypothetical protein